MFRVCRDATRVSGVPPINYTDTQEYAHVQVRIYVMKTRALASCVFRVLACYYGERSTDAARRKRNHPDPCSMLHDAPWTRTSSSNLAWGDTVRMDVWTCAVGWSRRPSRVLVAARHESCRTSVEVVDRGGRVGERRAEARCSPRSHHHGHMVKSSDWSGLLRLVAEKLLAYGLCDVAEFVLLLTRERRDGLLG